MEPHPLKATVKYPAGRDSQMMMPIPTQSSMPGAKTKPAGASYSGGDWDKAKRNSGPTKPRKQPTSHHVLDINAQLFEAIKQEKPRIVKRLLDSKASPNAQLGEQNQTPLILACGIQDDRARKTIVNLLLQRGADINQQTASGRNAITSAVLLDDMDTVSTLLEYDCDIKLVDCDGNNALCYAAMVGNENIVRRLVHESLKRKVEIDHQNMRGLTALLIACQEGHLEAARTLVIEGRASTTIRDLENFMNAHDWMKMKGHYSPQELTFLLPSRRRKHGYQNKKKGIKTLTDYLPISDPHEGQESPNVFTVRRKSLEEDKLVLPRLGDPHLMKSASATTLISTTSPLSGSGSVSMFSIPKRSMFEVAEPKRAYHHGSTSSSRATIPRPASIPSVPFSSVKTDVYRSSYLDRRKSFLSKNRQSEYYHSGALEPIGFDPKEKISKLATVQHVSNSTSDSKKHNSLPPLDRKI